MADADLSWDDAHRAVVRLMRVDHRTNIEFIAREYLGLALTLAGCAWAYRAWASGDLHGLVPPAGGPRRVRGGGVFQHRLSGLAHDASHYTLFRDKLVNELASDLLLMFPAGGDDPEVSRGPPRTPPVRRTTRCATPTSSGSTTPTPTISRSRSPGSGSATSSAGSGRPSILRYLLGRARAANLGQRPTGRSRGSTGSGWPGRSGGLTGSRPCRWCTLGRLAGLLAILGRAAPDGLSPLHAVAGDRAPQPRPGRRRPDQLAGLRGPPAPLRGRLPLRPGVPPDAPPFAMVPHHRVAEAHAILPRHRPYRDDVTVCRGFFFRRSGRRARRSSICSPASRARSSTRNPPFDRPRPLGGRRRTSDRASPDITDRAR